MYDIKIIQARVVDFVSNTFKTCTVGIKDSEIVSVGENLGDAKIVINAEGKIVSPGFIDIHIHEEIIGDTTDGDDYDIANKMLMMGVTTGVGGNCGNNRQSINDFLDFIDKNGAPINYLTFIGHNFLRSQVGIDNRYRKATQLEICKMKELVQAAIKEGVIGISFGLEYSPGVNFDEIIQICSATNNEQVLLSAHYRADADRGIESIHEMIEISKTTGMPMQISHLGSCTAMGMMRESLDVIQEAIREGVDIEADCYPYEAFSTFIGSAVFDEGCFERWNKTYDSIMLMEDPYRGLRCDKELFYKVRKEYPNMLVVAFVMNEEEVIEAIKAPFVSVTSDGLYRKGQGHPRGAGSFPKVLGKYVRDMKELSLISALKKMTLMPANRLGLNNKGRIEEGMDADIVIFDSETIVDCATFENPTKPPKGIEYVIVNGKIAVENNIVLNARLGKAIKRFRSKK
ncbi:MAG: amidohydrolase [Alkaliphilus sp.]|nr:amidohydrolase family protein [bacterium AH-315-E09]PHS35435.1 MAG: amidohydrolase [Alkaliphilus sp.]